MRTSLNEIKQIEQYVQERMTQEERRAFEIEVSKNEPLRLNVFLQRKIYQLLKFHRRNSYRNEVVSYHEKIFNDPARDHFKQKVLSLFQ